MRTESRSTQHYLTDPLGSTLRLTDNSAAKLVDYIYEPYGKATADAASTNSFQYTGRENDGTGLNYYRARYQHPALARFVSEDPIGLKGGPNLYAYVYGNPMSYKDATGTFGWGSGLVIIGAGVGLVITIHYAKQAGDDASARSENAIRCSRGDDAACGTAKINEKNMMQNTMKAVEAGHETAQTVELGPEASELWPRIKRFCQSFFR